MSFDFFCSPNYLFWWVVYAPPSSPSLMIPLQKVEAQEREDVLAGMAGKAIKGKVGKPKVKKLQLEETMPSPYGRRVVPEITAMKADASKKLLKKRKVAHGSRVGSTSVMMFVGIVILLLWNHAVFFVSNVLLFHCDRKSFVHESSWSIHRMKTLLKDPHTCKEWDLTSSHF